MKKKILICATTGCFFGHFLKKDIDEFKKLDYEITLIANFYEGCSVSNEEIEKFLNECNNSKINYINIPFSRSALNINNFKSYQMLKKLFKKNHYDIVYVHTPIASVITRLVVKKYRKNGTKVVYMVHGFHFYNGAPKKNWLIYYPIEKMCAKFTDVLITINNEDFEIAKKKFKKCKNIKYVHGIGLDEKKFQFNLSDDEKNNLRISLGIQNNDFVLIYPAEISKNKGQMWLIKSINNFLKKYSNIHLLLPGTDRLNGKCQKLTKKLNLENKIHFLGYRNDVPKLLFISNLSISSSNREGLPVNIMEAMYVGLPIIASNCRGNRDLVINNKNGFLFNLNDKDTFSKYIEKIYKEENLNKYSVENKEIIQKYLLENVIAEMNEIYSL